MSAIAKLHRKKLVDVCIDIFLMMTYTTAKRIKNISLKVIQLIFYVSVVPKIVNWFNKLLEQDWGNI